MSPARKRDARDRLVEAAAAQLWANGYAATSPADIQRAARAGQGSMYHHFSGKADLAHAAIERLAAELASGLDAVLETNPSGLPRVLAYLDRERDPLRGCRVGRLTADPDVINDGLLREPVQASFTRLQDRLANALRDAQRDGELARPLDPVALAAAVVAVVQGGYVLARAEQDPAAFRRAVDGARQLLLHANPPQTEEASANPTNHEVIE
jgi:TetR/AcrR family transcriptional regulator, transcriptional repressor for nem operon